MIIGRKNFELNKRTYIMGILNVTPDSFSDGGKFNNINSAIEHAKQMIKEGADIIDIGGESTRPQYQQISSQDEINRVVPIIKELKKEIPSCIISIDTYKSDVCEAAIFAGADMINDIWGFKYDEKMADLAYKYKLPSCLMHNRNNTNYKNLIPDFLKDLEECIKIAENHRVKKEQLILDPGIGFGKTYKQNLDIMNNLDIIKNKFDLPILLGTSKKSMIGKALGDVPTDKRNIGTIATTVLGITKGCNFIRVHDVKENKEACVMTDTIIRRC